MFYFIKLSTVLFIKILKLFYSDSKELQSWLDTINYVAACLSAPSLSGAVGNQKKFQRPLLPVAPTKLNFVSLFSH